MTNNVLAKISTVCEELSIWNQIFKLEVDFLSIACRLSEQETWFEWATIICLITEWDNDEIFFKQEIKKHIIRHAWSNFDIGTRYVYIYLWGWADWISLQL